MNAPSKLAWLMGAALAAGQACADSGVGGQAFAATDSEGFRTQRAGLDYLPVYAGRQDLLGVRVAVSGYEQDGWRRQGQQLSAMYRKRDPATLDGVDLEAGMARQDGHAILTLDANWHATLAPGRSVELFANRDWVETRRALDAAVAYTLAGAALEQGLGQHVTLVGMAGYQDFSDGNARRHVRAKLIYQPSLDLGLTLQLRHRRFRSDADSARTYFNPARYDETMLALGFRQRLAGWSASLTAGAGRQRVADAARTPTRLLEAGLESPLRGKQSLRLRAGINHSASFGGPDYRYRYAQAEWSVGF